jgi:death on curing protein
MNVVFLTIEDVLELHERSLQRYGGADGIRERALLESALAEPRTIFGGQFLHEDLFVMAAAYLFHLVKNHPFVDGNKRALATALALLDVNGVLISRGTNELFEVTIAVAEGRFTKETGAEILKRLAKTGS